MKEDIEVKTLTRRNSNQVSLGSRQRAEQPDNKQATELQQTPCDLPGGNRQRPLPALQIVRAKEEGNGVFIRKRQLALRFTHNIPSLRSSVVNSTGKCCFRHILPERIFPVKHTRNARLNQ